MKKTISVVALDPRAGSFYADEIQALFGKYVSVRMYSVRDGSAMGHLERADLFVVSTDAFDTTDEVQQHIPADCQVMGIEVSYRWSTIQKLREIPKGTRALFVNMTLKMAREGITQLEHLGVNHLELIAYYPGAELAENVDLAVTPDEERYVPKGIRQVIKLPHRSCTSGMMIEIALRLGFEELLETREFQAYFLSMATNDYSFGHMLERSTRVESRFDILMEILDEGLIGINEKGEIFACNEKAREITRVSPSLIAGRRGEEVFPYIPFRKCLETRTVQQAQVINVGGTNVNLTVIPVMRQSECIGAFATLQRFNDVEKRQNELRSQLFHKGHRAKYTFDDIVGQSAGICRTKEILKRMALTESPVLLIGETGTGKELFAHAVHSASKRSDGPFVAINVAAMPENLLESELFGYEEGAFTGAKKGGRPGLFEFAHTGTLFLDEVEGMSQAMQIKLLRVLQEREIMRVGGNQIIHVDVRIIAATNESLEKKVEEGSFRRDLYYRINTLPALIPPLRERGNDIFLLLERFAGETQRKFSLSPQVKQILAGYSWPGNIRELHNVAEYFSYTGQEVIRPEDLPPTFLRGREMAGLNRHGAARREAERSAAWKPERGGVGGGGSHDGSYTAGPAGDGGGWPGPEAETGDTGGWQRLEPEAMNQGEQKARSTEFWFVLEQLCRAAREGRLIGRESILAAAREAVFPLSQKEVRGLLEEMEREGLAKIGRGRGGSRVTQAGMELWKKRQITR